MNAVVRNELLNFSVYNFLGVTWDECLNHDKDDIIFKCAETAYLDMCRTITFNTATEKNGETFNRNVIEGLVRPEIKKLLQCDRNNYFDMLIQSCENLMHYIDDNPKGNSRWPKNGFSFGQAQKWINMTIKYMWLLGIWKEFDNIDDVLHPPVDNIILSAVWHEGHSENNKGQVSDKENEEIEWKLPLPYKNSFSDQDRWKKNCTDFIKPWSQWNENDYSEFQRNLPLFFEEKKPLEWENETWLAQKESEK